MTPEKITREDLEDGKKLEAAVAVFTLWRQKHVYWIIKNNRKSWRIQAWNRDEAYSGQFLVAAYSYSHCCGIQAYVLHDSLLVVAGLCSVLWSLLDH